MLVISPVISVCKQWHDTEHIKCEEVRRHSAGVYCYVLKPICNQHFFFLFMQLLQAAPVWLD